MSEVGNDWKNLRPQIGNLISKIDSLVQGSENIENLKNRVSAIEDKWFKQGSSVPRIDELEEKVNKIYTKLETMGWI